MALSEKGSVTAGLAAFAAELTFDDIPSEAVSHACLCLLDTAGCGVFGASLPWSGILRETLAEVDHTHTSTLIGSSVRLSSPHAALTNGAAIHAFELDDLHPRSIVHPGSVVLPASLAAASEVEGVSGRDLLVSLVAGYEVAARVGMSMGAAHLLRGFHPTGTHGALGAAAAAGSILRLSPEAMVQALGIAGTQSSGLMSAQYDSMVKRFHAGRASQSGVYAALLARRGYAGIGQLFEAKYGGYGSTLSPAFDLGAITAGLGSQWETLAVGFKPYSTNGSCHPTIDALLDLRARHGLAAGDVARVRLRVSSATKEHVGWAYEPKSVTTAQMNLPYIVAVVLADGDAFVRQFTESRIRDQALLDFTTRVSVERDPEIDAEGDAGRHHTKLTLELTDGTVLAEERQYATGSARAPMSAAEVRQKYDKLVDGVLEPRDATRLADLTGSLADQQHLDELVALLSGVRG